MKKYEKQAILKDADFGLYIETRDMVYDELSEQQTMFCCCGKLATGLHERSCKKFNNKVDVETINRLSYLLPKNK